MSDDKAWQQVQELAQAGKMDEAVALYETNVVKPSNPIDAVLRPHVKKTADELPDLMDGILLWADGQWRYTWLDAGGYWETDTDYIEVHDDQYWLPLPTFNPESEG